MRKSKRAIERHSVRASVAHEFAMANELYPSVVDGREEKGGVPSRLIKTDAGEAGKKEGTPWVMLRGSRTRAVRRAVWAWTSWRARERGG
jgi:hypothetical protein